MKTFNKFSDTSPKSIPPGVFAGASRMVLLIFMLAGFAEAQTTAGESKSPLAPWVGVWTITDDQENIRATKTNQETVVEIRLTADGKGLDISRKAPIQPDVMEVLIPDGSRRPVEEQNCSGSKSAHLVEETGLIMKSSEINCKEAGSIATSSLRIILAADRMADILAVKAGGQTRLVVRRLTFKHDLPSAEDSQAGWIAVAARISRSAPWNLGTIIQLSKTIDSRLLQAALLEKNAQLNLTPSLLKEMKKAKLPNEIIDLLVALAYRDQFHIEKNGRVELRPWIVSISGSTVRPSYFPGLVSYYPGTFYNCHNPYDYYFASTYTGSFPVGYCVRYYSPLWWDYPIYLPGGGGEGGGGNGSGGGRLTADQGYVQISPSDTRRHARPREGYISLYGIQGASSQSYPAGYSSGTAPASGVSSSGGHAGGDSGASSAAPSASPGGYSSGSSGGGTAVPR